jgi:hypothetical protein
MSEVTMSAAQVARMEGANIVPYDPYLDARMRPILQECKEKGIKIVTNQGWLDPVAAAERVIAIAQELGMKQLKVAAVSGGIVTDRIADMNLVFVETGEPIAAHRDQIVSGEVYLGASGIIEALKQDADLVITTRVADACLYLGPLAYEFGWDLEDHHLTARGMIIGHLMECGCQVSGGYFADPGYKNVPDLDNVGNPIVEVTESRIVISKLPGTGGVVSEETCKEQLLYEVHDPSRYYCPDCIVDFTKVTFNEIGKDEVEVIVDNAGLPKTSTLKALVGLTEGFMTEEMVLFAGPGAMERAELTKHILNERFKRIHLEAEEIRMDYVGINAVHRESSPAPQAPPYEVILRIAIKTKKREEADKLRKEVDPLAVNGAAGTGKWATSSPGSRVRPVVGLNSVLVPREAITPSVTVKELPRSQKEKRAVTS